jgi:hypothetical protein
LPEKNGVRFCSPFFFAKRRTWMNAKLKRRDMVKSLAAAGGLLALGGAAVAAAPTQNDKLAGEWLMEGRKDEPCAVFQQGRVLLLVNERGEFATAMMTEAKKFSVKGWEDGLSGELVEEDKKITWSNGTAWTCA